MDRLAIRKNSFEGIDSFGHVSARNLRDRRLPKDFKMNGVKLLNVGCGNVFHPDWENIDLKPRSSLVHHFDVRKSLPYPSNYFYACYSSHLLEHLNKNEAEHLLKEIYRVLIPKGFIRLVVPDLEKITRGYLSSLETVECGNEASEIQYDWMILELFDQISRSYSGGEMAAFLKNEGKKQPNFILDRIGQEAEQFWIADEIFSKKSLWESLKERSLSDCFNELRFFVSKIILLLVCGKKAKLSFKEGWFRNSGEIHRRMYDRFSLNRLVLKSGFIESKICRADESRISEFGVYCLDFYEGKARKPDSLYLEAVKGPLTRDNY